MEQSTRGFSTEWHCCFRANTDCSSNVAANGTYFRAINVSDAPTHCSTNDKPNNMVAHDATDGNTDCESNIHTINAPKCVTKLRANCHTVRASYCDSDTCAIYGNIHDGHDTNWNHAYRNKHTNLDHIYDTNSNECDNGYNRYHGYCVF
jgi:hypothetical protein